MGKEEHSHVEWWTDLLAAWDAGLVPPVSNSDELMRRLQATSAHVDSTLAKGVESLTVDEMLDLAAQLEFYMLDPVFGELLDMMNPGDNDHHHDAYSRHVMRLVDAIEKNYSRKDLAQFLAAVLARSYRDQQRLTALATRDALTNLYNRRGFYGYLVQWAAWSGRYKHPLGVMLVDVDYFKVVNDTLGHPAGDDALRSISDALCDAVRGSDLVGRYGGDEFAILAPETSAGELGELAQRVLELVRSSTLDASGKSMKLSVSIGIASADGSAAVTAEQLFSAADRSLYQAKNAGRDQAGPAIDATEE
jgi:diguanylate cyclase (GGDEF)-like protein